MKTAIGFKSKQVVAQYGLGSVLSIGITLYLFFGEYGGDIANLSGGPDIALGLLTVAGFFMIVRTIAFLLQPNALIQADQRGLYFPTFRSEGSFIAFRDIISVREYRHRQRNVLYTLSSFGALVVEWNEGKKKVLNVADVENVRNQILFLQEEATKNKNTF